jgi:hypothetical protein
MAELGLEETVYTDHPLQGEDSTPVPGMNLSDCVAKALSAESRWAPFNRYRGHGHNLATGRGERETTP